MRVTCPINRDIEIDDDRLDGQDRLRVEAALMKYAVDGGKPPGSFTVATSWAGRRAVVIQAFVDGKTWAIQIS